MTPTQALAKFREDMADQVEPYLWSDARVFDYIADAEDMWCRLTDGIADATTDEATLIETEAGTDWYDTHPSVMLIRAVQNDSTGEPLRVINHEDMPTSGIRFDGRTGVPRALVWGIEDNKVRVWPVPDSTVLIRLTVFRRPLSRTKPTAEFAIPAQYHERLLHWVKHLAYLKQDAETLDSKKAELEGITFRTYCEQAKTEQRRKRHKPRAVAYGGI